LLTEEEYHRAAPGGTGDIKTIGNYASVMRKCEFSKYFLIPHSTSISVPYNRVKKIIKKSNNER
jgi:hypothetical protein